MESKQSRLMMSTGSFYIPDEKKKTKPLGEDAHFISQNSQVIGVSDGVGSWASHGIDAGEYARQLMANANAICSKNSYPVDPKQVLIKAHWKTMADGTATACILSFDGRDNIIRAANVGDSGFIVVREGNVFYKSPVQQYGFNHPHQLGKGRSSGTGPEQAENISVKVEKGDVIVVGSDGLFDNLFTDDIASLVECGIEQKMSPKVMARSLARMAWKVSLDTSGLTPSPFEEASLKAGYKHRGGKNDDITVVVAFVYEFIEA